MTQSPKDWDPGAYQRFRGLRLRPALDLLLRLPEAPAGEVVDLGCGDGAVAGPLRDVFPDRRLVGVDGSAEMLGHAVGYDETRLSEIAQWAPEERPAVIFSNAALHWLPHHETLLPHLVQMLVPGGLMAVQMPRQFDEPSHRLLRDVAERLFPDRFWFGDWVAPVAPPAAYHRLLSPLGEVEVWETDYLQALPAVGDGHPVRAFTSATALRPFVARLGEGEVQAFLAAYDDGLGFAYPAEADGTVLFPFRRLFLVLRRD